MGAFKGSKFGGKFKLWAKMFIVIVKQFSHDEQKINCKKPTKCSRFFLFLKKMKVCEKTYFYYFPFKLESPLLFFFSLQNKILLKENILQTKSSSENRIKLWNFWFSHHFCHISRMKKRKNHVTYTKTRWFIWIFAFNQQTGTSWQ